LIKCNPAIKTLNDRDALRLALTPPLTPPKGENSLSLGEGWGEVRGCCTTIGTDHAPHTLEEKQGGCQRAMSGMPMIQFSLVSMLSLVDKEVLTIERLVELMAHNPATLFGVSQRGFIRKGYKADLVIVRKDAPWTVTKDCIQSKCQWSPVEGKTFQWHVAQTLVNGQIAYDAGKFNPNIRGEQIKFRGI
jgi:dihydroorotase